MKGFRCQTIYQNKCECDIHYGSGQDTADKHQAALYLHTQIAQQIHQTVQYRHKRILHIKLLVIRLKDIIDKQIMNTEKYSQTQYCKIKQQQGWQRIG